MRLITKKINKKKIEFVSVPLKFGSIPRMNNVLREKQNNRYRKKYKFMKRRIKSLILENAALCDEVAKIQESILIVKDERKFLLRKLLEYASEVECSQAYRHEMAVSNGPNMKPKKRKSLEDNARNISMS